LIVYHFDLDEAGNGKIVHLNTAGAARSPNTFTFNVIHIAGYQAHGEYLNRSWGQGQESHLRSVETGRYVHGLRDGTWSSQTYIMATGEANTSSETQYSGGIRQSVTNVWSNGRVTHSDVDDDTVYQFHSGRLEFLFELFVLDPPMGRVHR
jgi:hypothetical protein